MAYFNNNKRKGPAPTDGEQVVRVRVPKKEEREVLAIVESLLGANHLKLRCLDGIVRLGRIPDPWKRKYGFTKAMSSLQSHGTSKTKKQTSFGNTPARKWTGWIKKDIWENNHSHIFPIYQRFHLWILLINKFNKLLEYVFLLNGCILYKTSTKTLSRNNHRRGKSPPLWF